MATYLTYNQLTPDQQALYGNEAAYKQAVSNAQSTQTGTSQAIAPPVPGSREAQMQQANITSQGSADPSEFVQAVTGMQINQPTLPTGTQIRPQLQQAQTNELMQTPGVSTTPPQATSTTAVTPIATAATTTPAVQVDPTQFTKVQRTYTGETVGTAQTPQVTAQTTAAPTQTITAQQGQITSDATVAGQLEGLQQQVSNAIATGSDLPSWAVGAQRLVEANMAKRGLGASSMLSLIHI